MTIDELIKILENYEVFVDDDYGGSYKSVIAYAPDKKVSRAHTPIGTLKIIDTFEEIQQENQELKKLVIAMEEVANKYKEVFDKLKKRIDYMFQNEPVNSAEYDFYIEKLEELLKEVE